MKTTFHAKKSRISRTVQPIEFLETRIAPAALVFADHDASGYDTRVPVAVDAFGNTYVAGTFDGQITLDGISNSVTLTTQETGTVGQPIGSDIYVAKYSPDGELDWALSWGGVPMVGASGPQEIVEDIVVATGGDIFVLATFTTRNAGFGGMGNVNSPGGAADTMLLRINGTDGVANTGFGNVGMLQFGGAGEDRGGALAVSGTNLYFIGTYDSANPLLGGGEGTSYPSANGGSDAYVFNLNTDSGNMNTAFGTLGMVSFPSAGPEAAFDVCANVNDLFIATKQGPATSITKLNPGDGSIATSFGIGGRLDVPNLTAIAFDAPLDGTPFLLATGGVSNPGGYLKRFDSETGALDLSFAGDGTADLGTGAQLGLSIATDSSEGIYVAGVKSVKAGVPSQYFIAKFDDLGAPVASFGTNGRLYFGVSGNDDHRDISVAVDAAGYIHARGFFSGTTDIDPTKSVLTVTAVTPSPDAGHPALDTFLTTFDPNGVDAANPFSLVDNSGDTVRLVYSGPGRLSITPGTTFGVDIERIEAFDTDGTTKLTISISGSETGTTTIAHFVTPGPAQDLGILKLGSNVILGSGFASTEPALKITGKATKLLLSDINPNAVIKLGEGLPYDFTGDDTTSDTKNNAPFVKMRNVSSNVVIDVTGDGMPAGVGGGGLGRVLVESWNGAGLIKTTQSILGYRQKTADCYVVFEVDKLGVGSSTRADMGSITITNGSWGSSGSEIEGNCGSFSCSAFLAGATISAGNIDKFLVKNGPYAGTTTLKDPSSGQLGTFKVNSDFTGYVDSTNSIINIKVSGDFKGSLVAASIGKIQAFAFDGTTTGDLYKDALRHQIIAQSGSLGSLKTKGGGIKNYEIEALTVIDGISVSTGNTGTSVSLNALDNVRIIAAEIGDTTIAIKPSTGAGAITLRAMKDVIYDMETAIGSITASHGIADSQLSAGTNIGKISVGSTDFPLEGVINSKFLAGSNLGGDGIIDGDETWTRNGKIESITVKGAVTTSTFSAGIDPTNGIFGDGDDVAGAGAAPGGTNKSIGSMRFGAGSGTAAGSPALTHTWVIQGASFKDLKVNSTAVALSSLPKYLQIGGAEAATDILIRTI